MIQDKSPWRHFVNKVTTISCTKAENFLFYVRLPIKTVLQPTAVIRFQYQTFCTKLPLISLDSRLTSLFETAIRTNVTREFETVIVLFVYCDRCLQFLAQYYLIMKWKLYDGFVRLLALGLPAVVDNYLVTC